MINNQYIMLFIYVMLTLTGIYFWMKGTGRIKNTNPDYVPSLGLFKVCGALIAISGLIAFIIAVIKMI
jgi:hypothetical protein